MGGNLVESLIGAVVLIVAVGFLAFAYSKTEIRAVSGYTLSAEFDRIDGLNVGADVRLSGIKVGTVTSQVLNLQTYQAVVEMSVEPKVTLPEDSTAKITSDGLFGDKYIVLDPGGSPDMLSPGDSITFTQGSVDLMSLIGQAIFSAGGAGGESKAAQ